MGSVAWLIDRAYIPRLPPVSTWVLDQNVQLIIYANISSAYTFLLAALASKDKLTQS